MVSLAIDHGNHVVVYKKAYNTEDSRQILHTMPIGSDWVRVNIINPLDENASLPIPHNEMKTVGEVVGAFIVLPKKLITLDSRVCCQN